MPIDPSPSFSSNTAINYKSETPVVDTTTALEQPFPVRKTIPKPSKRTEVIVEELASLNELKWFLEEDERPVIIK